MYSRQTKELLRLRNEKNGWGLQGNLTPLGSFLVVIGVFHSIAWRNAAAVAQGDKARAIRNSPARTIKKLLYSVPFTAAFMTKEPKIKTGMYRGRTIRGIKTLLCRAPSIKAAPIDPTRLKVGVPRSIDIPNGRNEVLGRL